MITFGVATTITDLQQILSLQQANLPKTISREEAKTQGFVTVEHDLELLSKMNQPYPHIVARDNGQIVGYALVMMRSLEKEIPVLVPMFKQINSISYQNQLLENSQYVVMGQVCIAKTHRGKGLFKGLYQTMQEKLQAHFDYIITEIATRNTRSIRAHEKVGFQNIKTYSSETGEEWSIVLLNLNV